HRPPASGPPRGAGSGPEWGFALEWPKAWGQTPEAGAAFNWRIPAPISGQTRATIPVRGTESCGRTHMGSTRGAGQRGGWVAVWRGGGGGGGGGGARGPPRRADKGSLRPPPGRGGAARGAATPARQSVAPGPG